MKQGAGTRMRKRSIVDQGCGCVVVILATDDY